MYHHLMEKFPSVFTPFRLICTMTENGLQVKGKNVRLLSFVQYGTYYTYTPFLNNVPFVALRAKLRMYIDTESSEVV